MTLGDFFSGNWTWMQLIGELWPIVLPAAIMYWAGYAKGWNDGARDAERMLGRILK
jgi:hypothetical protein